MSYCRIGTQTSMFAVVVRCAISYFLTDKVFEVNLIDI